MALFGFKKNKKSKVLIVEDDALLAKVFVEGFAGEGFEVLNITNGLEAVEGAVKFSPDIILLDLILPGIDGFEVLRRLKSDTKTSKIPVIIVSNLDNVPDIKSAKTLGAEEYFIKADTELEKIIKFSKGKVKL